ncbi:hypothetical protein HanRHA438_Chr13g0624431 [Helianthus annuus]|nr:hypothetical protein HanRHA438_Chr13g0624431 [Helianthus annuus]
MISLSFHSGLPRLRVHGGKASSFVAREDDVANQRCELTTEIKKKLTDHQEGKPTHIILEVPLTQIYLQQESNTKDPIFQRHKSSTLSSMGRIQALAKPTFPYRTIILLKCKLSVHSRLVIGYQLWSRAYHCIR